MLSFTFGGKNSFEDYGILIAKRPSIPSPKRRIKNVTVPGRNSSVKFDENTYEDITLTVECSVKGESVSNRIDEIKGWLIGSGESDLIFSFQENKRFKAQVVNSTDFAQVLKYFSKFIIVFNCQPFKYSSSNELKVLSASGKVNNPGSIYAEPKIKVFGSGDVTLNINAQVLKFKGISSHIIIDSILQNCYNDSGENLNNKMTGEFPVLAVGDSNISWSGNVSKIEITPNWRWL